MQYWNNIKPKGPPSLALIPLPFLARWSIPCAHVLGRSEEARSFQQQYFPRNNNYFSRNKRAGGLQHSDLAHSKGRKITAQLSSSRKSQLFLVWFLGGIEHKFEFSCCLQETWDLPQKKDNLGRWVQNHGCGRCSIQDCFVLPFFLKCYCTTSGFSLVHLLRWSSQPDAEQQMQLWIVH